MARTFPIELGRLQNSPVLADSKTRALALPPYQLIGAKFAL